MLDSLMDLADPIQVLLLSSVLEVAINPWSMAADPSTKVGRIVCRDKI